MIYRKKALEAYEELFDIPIKLMELEIVKNWLSLYRPTIEYIFDFDSNSEVLSWTAFAYEYQGLDFLLQTIQSLDQADISLLSECEAEEKLIEKVLQIETILENC